MKSRDSRAVWLVSRTDPYQPHPYYQDDEDDDDDDGDEEDYDDDDDDDGGYNDDDDVQEKLTPNWENLTPN